MKSGAGFVVDPQTDPKIGENRKVLFRTFNSLLMDSVRQQVGVKGTDQGKDETTIQEKSNSNLIDKNMQGKDTYFLSERVGTALGEKIKESKSSEKEFIFQGQPNEPSNYVPSSHFIAPPSEERESLREQVKDNEM